MAHETASRIRSTIFQPALILCERDWTMFSTASTTKLLDSSLMRVEETKTSNGFRTAMRSSAELSSSLSKNLVDSCLSESTAYMDTSLLGRWATSTRCWLNGS